MALRPLKSLPLRLRLRVRRFRNKVQKRRQPRYWSRQKPRVPVAGDRRIGDILTVEVHPYALLGHQAAGWMSGYLWARDLDVAYVGSRLPEDHDGLFSFANTGRDASVRHPKVVRLPATEDERDHTSLKLLQARVWAARARWPRRRIEFRLPLDQPRFDHTPAADVLRAAVLDGTSGPLLRQLEAGTEYVAVHIRRPAFANDIGPQTHPDRWLTSEWYAQLIARLQQSGALSGLAVRVYSLGDPESFAPLAAMDGVELRLNGNRDTDFVELAAARLLVAAPSSFSFNAALVSRGAILARAPWWHHIPDEGRWAHLSAGGEFDDLSLDRAVKASFLSRHRVE